MRGCPDGRPERHGPRGHGGRNLIRAATLVALPVALALAACAGARLERFQAELAERDSATAALEHWCAVRHLAAPPRVTADRVEGPAVAEPTDARSLLALPAAAPLAYRHVRLSCGAKVLSEAHNWYVPARLSPSMNATLAGTRTPFGKVVAPLGFRRERLDGQRGARPECPADTILSHRALLRLPDGQPLALLVECYGRANLAQGAK